MQVQARRKVQRAIGAVLEAVTHERNGTVDSAVEVLRDGTRHALFDVRAQSRSDVDLFSGDIQQHAFRVRFWRGKTLRESNLESVASRERRRVFIRDPQPCQRQGSGGGDTLRQAKILFETAAFD